MVKLKEHNCDWCSKSYASVESLQAHFVGGKHNVGAKHHALAHPHTPPPLPFSVSLLLRHCDHTRHSFPAGLAQGSVSNRSDALACAFPALSSPSACLLFLREKNTMFFMSLQLKKWAGGRLQQLKPMQN